jgi:APA family basic amino acid/polyamine antiporter
MTQELKRTLGTTDLTLLVIGNVIGSGIFLVPGTVLAQSGGSVSIAMAVWLVGGVLSLLGALSYGELGAMDRGPGGLYAYIRDGFGPFPAFLYGWTLFFVIGAGTVAALAVAATDYLEQFGPLTGLAKKGIAVGLIAGMMVINVLNTRSSTTVLNVATAIKVGAILIMSALLFTLGTGSPPTVPGAAVAAALPAVSFSSVGLSLIAVLWTYEGWQYATFIGGEAKQPQRSVPLAIGIGTVCLIVLYLLANFAYLAALGPERLATSDRVAGEAMAVVMGPTVGWIVALAIIISMVSAAHASVITAPRVYFTMARDGLFFRKLSEIHPRFGTPALAIVTNCVWAALLAISGTFEQLLTYVVFIGWMFYALGAAAVIALRIKHPHAVRPFRVPGYPYTPLLFILAAIAIVANTIYTQPLQSLIGIGVVLAGAPAYFLWRRRPAPSA